MDKSKFNVSINGGTIGALAFGPGASASSTITTDKTATPTTLSFSISSTSPEAMAAYLDACAAAIRAGKSGPPPMPKGVSGSVSWVGR